MKIQNSPKLILGLLCATSISATASVVADKMVLTENSDTTLTAQYYAGAALIDTQVETASPNDQWSFTTSVAFAMNGQTGGEIYWFEPPPVPFDPGEIDANSVFIGNQSETPAVEDLVVDVASDIETANYVSEFNGQMGTLDGVEIVFNDLGDSGSVPDPASTGLLLFATTGALAALKKHVRRS